MKIKLETFDIDVVGDAYTENDYGDSYPSNQEWPAYGLYCFLEDAIKIIEELQKEISELKKKNKEENILYALHLNGKLLDTKVWKEYSKSYGTNELYGWRPPKRIYYKISHARNGIKHLPKQIQNKVKIVIYKPEREKE